MIPLKTFSGSTLRCGIEPPAPLIDGVLWEDDFVMLLGSEKAGKSILAQQMAFALTTGTPFLDSYAVPRAVDILYIQAEGKRPDFVDRMNRMAATLPLDDTRFTHLPKKFLPLDVEEYFESLIRAIDEMPTKPRVIFIDPLYMSMGGDLSDNKDARKFLASAAFLMDRYKSAVVLVHHDSKDVVHEGRYIERGDKGSYGSVFFRAIVDHILYLRKQRDGVRVLSCETQRSGRVLEREELILVQPNPLCFEIKGDYKAYEEVIRKHLLMAGPAGTTREGLLLATGLSESSVDKALRHLTLDSFAEKLTEQSPVLYRAVSDTSKRPHRSQASAQAPSRLL